MERSIIKGEFVKSMLKKKKKVTLVLHCHWLLVNLLLIIMSSFQIINGVQ